MHISESYDVVVPWLSRIIALQSTLDSSVFIVPFIVDIYHFRFVCELMLIGKFKVNTYMVTFPIGLS